MKKFAICYLLFAICVCGFAANAFADDVSVGRAAVTSVAAAQSAAAPGATVVSRNIPTVSESAPAPAIATRTGPALQTTTSRVAVQNVGAARVAGGAEPGQNLMFRQPVARADLAPTGTGVSRVLTAPVTRSAAMTTAQAETAADQRSAFHANEKGIAGESAPIRRAGVNLRPTVAEVGGRATIGDTGTMTGTNIGNEQGRVATARAAAATPRVTQASIAEMTDRLTAVNDLQSACAMQYMDCMDQFCNVLDANQKRCSCSSRLNTYTKTERAVKDANVQLNEVAQRIRYVGLSADEIRAIMRATEAELAMTGQRDTTENRNMLNQIEKLIRNPETYIDDAGGNVIDLDFNFDFENMDFTEMFNLDMFGFGNNQSFANMRGTTLYNAAKNRCKNVLNDCKAQGANTTQITARYDMEIDRDCIAFEQGLERMNNTLRTNVRAAKGMLEQARLAVLNNQNTYDAKQCVGALENCMTDDMVCGDSYIKCMDPTKSYIDENGQIVLGRDIVTIRKYMTNFNAAEINLSNARASMMNDNFCSAAGNDGRCIVRFLLEKIGEGPTATSGLCRAVLDRCRRVSYTEDGRTYKTDNDVVKNYIQRAMINIKAGQERVIAEFASTCMQDVAYCYSQQVSQVTAWSSNAAVASIQMIMRSACRNIALTCGFAIFSEPDDGIKCRLTNGTTVPDECINQVSEIFYQSMLCPENSTYMPEVLNASTAPTPGLYNSQYGRYWVNARCLCDASYGYDAGRCMSCPNNSTFTPVPTPPFPPTSQCPSKNTDVSQGCPIIGCKCAANHMSKNGQCVKITE